jgi:hypothetical protein
MSGGHFDCDFSYNRLYDMADKVEIDGDPVFADFLRDVSQLIHDYDWYRSADTSKEEWHESRRNFIQKWKNTPFEELAEASIKKRVEKMFKEVFTPEDIREPWW